MLALCQQFLDAARAVRIAGPNAPTWLQVSEDDIEGEFFIDVEGGSTQAINPATRYNQGQQMITQIVPMIAQMGYDPEPALRSALQYMGFNPDHVLIKAPPPPAPMMPEQGMMPGMPAEQPGMVPGSEMMQQLSDMGGAPIPGAEAGGTLY
jgi:hypothetical protein